MGVQLEGQPTVIDQQSGGAQNGSPQNGSPQMPQWNFGPMDLTDLTTLDSPLAEALFSDVDATFAPAEEGTGTGYQPTSITELVKQNGGSSSDSNHANPSLTAPPQQGQQQPVQQQQYQPVATGGDSKLHILVVSELGLERPLAVFKLGHCNPLCLSGGR